MVVALIYLVMGLVAVSVIMMLLFGAKNGAARLQGQGKLAMFAFALPLIVFAIIYAVNTGHPNPFAIAMVTTAVVMIASGLVALLVAGVRGLVK